MLPVFSLLWRKNKNSDSDSNIMQQWIPSTHQLKSKWLGLQSQPQKLTWNLSWLSIDKWPVSVIIFTFFFFFNFLCNVNTCTTFGSKFKIPHRVQSSRRLLDHNFFSLLNDHLCIHVKLIQSYETFLSRKNH